MIRLRRTRRRNLNVRARMKEAARNKARTVRTRGIFVLPNLFTTASLLCAFMAVLQAIDGHFSTAAVLIFASMLFDGMDGRVARLTNTASEFGVQFDSIADMTAFGVAPAVVMYQFCLMHLGSMGCAASFIYCLCAGIRLARFNCNVHVVDKRFFQGLPSPAAAALLAGFVWLVAEGRIPEYLYAYLPWFAFGLTIYAGLTMVCNAPFFSGKAPGSLRKAPFWAIALMCAVFIFISSNPPFAIFVLFCLYALSGYVYQAWLFFYDRPNPVIPVKETPAVESSEQ